MSKVNPPTKGEKRKVSGVLFRRAFKKLTLQLGSKNAAARHLGFKDATASPIQSLLRPNTRVCETQYADHLAKALATDIFLDEAAPAHKSPPGKGLQMNADPPPVKAPPAPAYIKAYSNYNLFYVSEENYTLALVQHDGSLPGLAAQLQQFKQKNPDLFERRASWQDAKEALRECDRRWGARQGGL